jgi:hypothetical protein
MYTYEERHAPVIWDNIPLNLAGCKAKIITDKHTYRKATVIHAVPGMIFFETEAKDRLVYSGDYSVYLDRLASPEGAVTGQAPEVP